MPLIAAAAAGRLERFNIHHAPPESFDTVPGIHNDVCGLMMTRTEPVFTRSTLQCPTLPKRWIRREFIKAKLLIKDVLKAESRLLEQSRQRLISSRRGGWRRWEHFDPYKILLANFKPTNVEVSLWTPSPRSSARSKLTPNWFPLPRRIRKCDEQLLFYVSC